jgi:VIT1/CCC1 family predicted Fe2+/Mn2+ transporter
VSFCASCGCALPLEPEAQSLGTPAPARQRPQPAAREPAIATRPTRVAQKSASARSVPARPPLISLIAWLDFVSGALLLLAAFVFMAPALFGDDVEPGVRTTLVIMSTVSALVGVTTVTAGIGLWRLRSFGRTMQVVLGWIGLIGFPIGTVVSILILVYLKRTDIAALFSDA